LSQATEDADNTPAAATIAIGDAVAPAAFMAADECAGRHLARALAALTSCAATRNATAAATVCAGCQPACTAVECVQICGDPACACACAQGLSFRVALCYAVVMRITKRRKRL
jgi:hypothetical protein